MTDKIRKSFKIIKADDELKEKTLTFLRRKPRLVTWKRGFSVAVCALAIVCGMGGYNVYFTETAYISIDVNPSLELGINRFDRVISVESYNEDGETIENFINIKNKSYTDAVEILLQKDSLGAYMSDTSWLGFAVASDDQKEQQEIISRLEACSNDANVRSHCRGMGTDTIEEAHHNGFSFGKYQAYLDVKSCDSSITEEDCKNMSMREIQDRITECENRGNRENVPSQTEGQGQEQGQGHHHGNGSGNGHGHEE